MIKEIRRKSILEVVYKDEEGTGIGPTLEFYSTVSNELRSDTSLWRSNTTDGTLFPKGI
jgi:E3 ubiquitin-protein ligase TRIP12